MQMNAELGWLLSGGDDCRIGVVKLSTLQPLPPLSCEVGVLSLAFDHSRVLAGCEDCRLRVWDYGVAEVAEGSFADKEAWRRLSTQMEAERTRRDQARAQGRQ